MTSAYPLGGAEIVGINLLLVKLVKSFGNYRNHKNFVETQRGTNR